MEKSFYGQICSKFENTESYDHAQNTVDAYWTNKHTAILVTTGTISTDLVVEKYRYGIPSVSYTHLDVYKRQA